MILLGTRQNEKSFVGKIYVFFLGKKKYHVYKIVHFHIKFILSHGLQGSALLLTAELATVFIFTLQYLFDWQVTISEL